MDKIDIINRIGYIRVKAKLTQKALSNAIGMNPSYINRLESKKDFLPSVEVLLKIIEVCGSSTEEFFYSDITTYERDKQILDKIKSFSDDIKDYILNYDPELMDLFVKLNAKAVKIDTTNSHKSSSDDNKF